MPQLTDPARTKRHERIARTAGVRTVERPLPGGGSFSLHYTRTGPAGGVPLLVLPGGPGLATVLPYQGLRAKAAGLGLDLVMMEHRGVGLSRTEGLPREAMALADVVADVEAILDAEGIEKVVVYGSSYGSYVAQTFCAGHPERVSGLVLDSAMIGAGSSVSSTEMINRLFWTGTPETEDQAATVRRLVSRGVIDAAEVFPLQFLYEFGGPAMTHSMLTLLEAGRGRRLWRWINRLGDGEIMTPRPFVMEFDLVGEIAFRELDYAPTPDDKPLQIGSFHKVAANFSPFEGEPFDLRKELPSFSWPTVVISGDRDVRTPRSVAAEIVALVPGATLLAVREHGHSALDTQRSLALDIMRSVTTSISDSGARDPATLPVDPAGRPGLMRRVVSARLDLARVLPHKLS